MVNINNNNLIDFNTALKITKEYVLVYTSPSIGHIFSIQRKSLIKNILLQFTLTDYEIKGTDRPEFVAYKLYGDVEYIWIVLVINDIINPYYQWILPSSSIYEYAEQKYKNVGGINAVKYYLDKNNEKYYNIVKKPGTNEWYDHLDTKYQYIQFKGTLNKVSNIDYELANNESFRNIKVLKPKDLLNFIYKLGKAITEAKI